MTPTPDDSAPPSPSLDDLLATERLLEQRLAARRCECEAAVERARAAAEERVGERRQCIAGEEAERFEQGRRQFDERLADEMRRREAALSSGLARLNDVRRELCARMLRDLLLLR